MTETEQIILCHITQIDTSLKDIFGIINSTRTNVAVADNDYSIHKKECFERHRNDAIIVEAVTNIKSFEDWRKWFLRWLIPAIAASIPTVAAFTIYLDRHLP